MAQTLNVLFEDDDILVVNKPAGVLTIPGRQTEESLRDVIARLLRIEASLRLVHRLDRQTSGVLVLAKTLDAQRDLSRQWRHREVDKFYLALVRGTPPQDEGFIDAPLAPHPRKSNLMIVPTVKGRPSQTEWSVVERFRGFALLRCRLLTGRQHQIRVHLKYIGLPLAVDELYGNAKPLLLSEIKRNYRPNRNRIERPLIGRLTLHAERIVFRHPRRDEKLTLDAPLPKDFKAAVNQLHKCAR